MTEGDTFLFGGKVLKFLNLSEKGVHVALTKDKRPKIPSYAGGRMPLTSELASQVKKLISKKQSLESYPDNSLKTVFCLLTFSLVTPTQK